MLKNTILMIYLLIMTVLFAAACSDDTDKDITTENAGDTSSVTDQITETEKTIDMTILTKTDYEGAEVNIYAWVHPVFYNNFIAETENGDPVNDAVYRRNLNVEEYFNVKLNITGEDAILNKVKSSIMSGNDDYNFIEGRMDSAIIPLANSGYLSDLNEIPGMDLSQPWWDGRFISQMSVKNKLYSILGDINVNSILTYIYFYNKTLAEEYKIDDIYSKIGDGTWTFDTAYNMAKITAHDLNGDGIMDEKDVWGTMSENYDLKLYYLAGGNSTVSKDEDDVPYLTFNTPHAADVLQKAYDMLKDDHVTFIAENFTNLDNLWEGYIFPMFVNDQALFIFNSITNAYQYYRGMVSDYGIIPVPKYDESQETYYNSISSGWTTNIAIPVTNTRTELTGFILEALAIESHTLLFDAFYNNLYANKALRDTESLKMITLINNTRCFDIGIINNLGDISNVFSQLFNSKELNFASVYAKNESKFETALVKILEG